jgi:hypothetical protein
MHSKDRFYSGIKEYLEEQVPDKQISLSKKHLSKIKNNITKHLGVDSFVAEEIIRNFLQVTKDHVLSGDVVLLKTLGALYISNPKTDSNKKRIFLKFKTSRSLTKKLNKGRNV